MPGGQILGPTYDYTQRLLDFSLEAGREADALPPGEETLDSSMPRVTDLLAHEDLIDPELPPEGDPEPFDLTRQPLDFPPTAPPACRTWRAPMKVSCCRWAIPRSGLWQYSSLRRRDPLRRAGSGNAHRGTGFAVTVGEIEVTECQMVSQFSGNAQEGPKFTRGYGLTFGYGERKAMSMALVDRALKAWGSR